MAALIRSARLLKIFCQTSLIRARPCVSSTVYSRHFVSEPSIHQKHNPNVSRPTTSRRSYSVEKSKDVASESQLASPVDLYWQNMDYSKFSMATKSFAEFSTIIQERLRYSIPFSKLEFNYLMNLAENAEDMSADEATTVIMATSYNYNVNMKKSQCAEWTEYQHSKIKSKGVALNTRYYNQLMGARIHNDIKFTPVEVLAEMKEDNIDPNRMTFQRVIQKYCTAGDTKSTSMVLEHMKSMDIPINIYQYNLVMRGHIIAGDHQSARDLFQNAGEMGFKPDQHSYFNMILSKALQNDLSGVKEMLAEAQDVVNISDGFLCSMLEELTKNGADKEIVNYILERLKDTSTYYYNEAHMTLRVLMEQGLYDTAFEFFSGLTNPNAGIFYKVAAIVDMPIEKLVSFSKILVAEDCRKSSLVNYLDIVVFDFNYKKGIEIIPYIKEEGQMRVQYTWPFLAYFRHVKDMEGLKQFLPLCEAEFTTAFDYLVPAFKQLGVSPTESAKILQEHSQFSPAQISTCQLLMEETVEDALQTANEAESLASLPSGRNVSVLTYNICKEGFITTENWRQILQLFNIVRGKSDDKLFLTPVMRRVCNLAKDNDAVSEEMNKITPGLEWTLEGEGSNLQVKTTRKQVPRQHYDFNTMSLDELLDLNKKLNIKGLPYVLIGKCLKEKRLSLVPELVKRTDCSYLSAFVLARLVVIGLFEEKDMNMVKSALFALAQKDGFVVEKNLIFIATERLAKDGQLQDALKLVQAFGAEKETKPYREEFNCQFGMFQVDPTAENFKWANEMAKALMENEFIRPQDRIRFSRMFFNFISQSDDVNVICDSINALQSCVDRVPLYQVLIPFTSKAKKESLQKVMNHLYNITSEQHALTSLALALIFTDQIPIAEKVLATPGLRVLSSTLNNVSIRGPNATEKLETVFRLVKTVPGVDKARFLITILRSMVLDEECEKEKCLEFVKTRFDEEDAPLLQSEQEFVSKLVEEKRTKNPKQTTDEALLAEGGNNS